MASVASVADSELPIRAVAEILGVSVVTLRRWDGDGTLVARRGARGVRLYRREDVERVKAARATEAAPAPTRTSLRAPPTSFTGRVAELADLGARFEGGAYVVTIVGPPGVGKTRLATEYALHQPHPAWFSDLSDATTLDQVCAVLERDLGLAGSPQRSTDAAVDQIVATLSRRPRLLLVLDNLEQLAPVVAPFVSRMARDLPHVRVLATSRERLRIAAESVLELAPLDLASEATELFVARAAGKCRPDDPAVGAIVRRLDGIPLAIELAAARLGVLEPKELLERFGDRLLALPPGPRDAAARQATLHDAIEWSWRLLGAAEQLALAQCSVFRGGFSVDAAEHVIDLSRAPGAPPVVDVLSALFDRSLLRSSREPLLEERRLSLIASIAEYAAQKLASMGVESETVDRHTAFFVERGRAWADACESPSERTAMHRLAIEEPNVLAAAARARDPLLSIEAVTLVEPLLWRRGCLDAHFDALVRARSRAESADVPVELRARVLRSIARARIWRGDAEGGGVDAAQGIALVAGTPVEPSLLRVASTSLHRRGALDEAVRAAERALDRDVAFGDRRGEGLDCMLLGGLFLENQHDRARELLERAQPMLHDLGRPTQEGITRMYLGMLYQDLGRLDDARLAMEGAAKLLDSDPRRAGYAVGLVGSILYEQGRLDAAVVEYERALAVLADAPWPPFDAILRARLALARAEAGDPRAGAADMAAAEAMAAGAPEWARGALALHRAHLEPSRAAAIAARFPARDQYELRLAHRWLARARAHASGGGTGEATLVVGPSGRWFRAPGGSRIELGHRKPLCRILLCLAEERARGDRGVPVERLVREGWPGERVLASAGAKRVRVAIATLREFGLRDLLVRRADGYALALAAGVRIER